MRDYTNNIDNLIYDKSIALELRIYRLASMLREQDAVPYHLWYLIQLLADRYLSKDLSMPKSTNSESNCFNKILLFFAGIFVGLFLMFFVIAFSQKM